MTVQLPDKGDGSRRRSRAAHKRRSRQPPTKVLLAAVIVVVVGGLVWVTAGLVGDRHDGVTPHAPPVTEGSVPFEGPGPALVVLTDAGGSVYGITILAPRTGTIVHVPPGTLVEVTSLGPTSLGDAKRNGSLDLLRHSLENVLGATFDAAVDLQPDDLAALVESVGPLSVSADRTIGPEDAVAFLSALGDGSSLERIARHQAFWSAYLEELGPDQPSPVLGDVAGAVASLAGVTAHHVMLPVEGISGDLYRVVDDNLPALVERVFPDLVPGARFRVQILNGAGTPGVAQVVQPLLIDAGARVTLSGNADRFDYATTQVVYYDDARLDAAKAIRAALGTGTIVKSLAGLDVVDVTVVVGADFVRAHPGTSPTSEG